MGDIVMTTIQPGIVYYISDNLGKYRQSIKKKNL